MATTPDLRQSGSREVLDRIAPDATAASPTLLQDIAESINFNVKPLIDMRESSTPDQVLNLSGITAQDPNISVKKTVPPINGVIPTFASGTITFPTASGNNAVPSVGSNFLITISNDSFLKVGIYIDDSGNIVMVAGTEGASEAAATFPALQENAHAVGYVVLETVGAVIQTITNARIYQYMGPGAVAEYLTPTNTQNVENKTIAGGNNSYDFSDVTIASNTFAKPTSTVARITSGSGPLNTITGGNDGNFLILENRSGSTITVANDSAANGFLTGTNADINLQDDASLKLVYHATDARWQIVGGTGGGTGSGGINYLETAEVNIDGEVATMTGWTTTGTGGPAVIAQITSAGDVLRGSGSIVIRDPSTSFDGTIYADFEVPEADANKLLDIQFDFKARGAYSAGDWTIKIIQDPTGTPVDITPAVTDLPAGQGLFNSAWVSKAAGTYRLQFTNSKGATIALADAMVIDNVKVTPDTTVSGTAATEWQTYTPGTAGFGTITSLQAEWRQIGDSIEIRGEFTSGTVAASEARIDLPNGWAVGGNITGQAIACGKFGPNSGSAFSFHMLATSGDTFLNIGAVADGGGTNQLTPQNGNAVLGSTTIATFNSGPIPIGALAGAGTLNAGVNNVEYASSANPSFGFNASSTAAHTVYGPTGSPINENLTGDREKVVQFQSDFQPTDEFTLEIDTTGNGRWQPIDNRVNLTTWPSVNFGARITTTASNQVTVRFFRFAAPGTTYDSLTGAQEWTAVLGSAGYWRVKKHRSGIPVGFGIVTQSNPGLTPAQIPWTDLSFSSTPAGWSVGTAKGKAIQDADGNWDVTINIQATATSFNTTTVTLDGVSPLASFNALACDPNTGTVVGGSNITSSGVIRLTKTAAGTSFNVSGTFLCSSKPSF